MAKLSVLLGFTKWVSMDVLYLKINDVLEYNLPYVQSYFTCNLGAMLENWQGFCWTRNKAVGSSYLFTYS